MNDTKPNQPNEYQELSQTEMGQIGGGGGHGASAETDFIVRIWGIPDITRTRVETYTFF